MDIKKAIENRRSIYALSKEEVVNKDKVEEIIRFAMKFTPAAFNVQSGRSVILFAKQHNDLWEHVKDSLKKIVPADNFPTTENKINSFKNGYATVLFYEDLASVEGMQKNFAAYAENFPSWSLQSIGMLQYVSWTMLEAEGLGVNLQHYNIFLEEKLQKLYNISTKWKLISQMVVGKVVEPAGNKDFQATNDFVKVFK